MGKSKNRPEHKQKVAARIKKKKDTYHQKVNRLKKIIENAKQKQNESEDQFSDGDEEE